MLAAVAATAFDPTPPPAAVDVALVRNVDLEEAATAAIAALGGLPDLTGKSVVVKPNLNFGGTPPLCPSIEVIRAAVVAAFAAGAASVVIADRSPSGLDQQTVFDNTGITALCTELGCTSLDLGTTERTLVSHERAVHWVDGVPIYEGATGFDYVINVCVCRMHPNAVYSAALKNWVGVLPHADRGTCHANFAGTVGELHCGLREDLVLLDCSVMLTDNDPWTTHELNIVAATTDPVLADVVGLACLRYAIGEMGTTDPMAPGVTDVPIWHQGQIVRALELDLGGLSTADKTFTYSSAGISEIAQIAVQWTEGQTDDVLVLETSGATFAPIVTATPGTAATWYWSDGTTSTELSPTKDFGSAATRIHRVVFSPGSGVQYGNFGYDAGDGGATGAGWDLLTQQGLVDVFGLHELTGLERLMVNRCPIRAVDVHGMASLRYVECVHESGVDAACDRACITDCASLVRAAFEQCTVHDPFSIAGCPAIQDIRGALNQFTRILGIGESHRALEHVCVRGTALAADALRDLSGLTGLGELWIYGCTGLSGTLTVHSDTLWSLQAQVNAYTAVDLSACPAASQVNLSYNSLGQAAVDAVIHAIAIGSVNGGTLDLTHNTAPSAEGLEDVAIIEGRSWTVAVDP